MCPRKEEQMDLLNSWFLLTCDEEQRTNLVFFSP